MRGSGISNKINSRGAKCFHLEFFSPIKTSGNKSIPVRVGYSLLISSNYTLLGVSIDQHYTFTNPRCVKKWINRQSPIDQYVDQPSMTIFPSIFDLFIRATRTISYEMKQILVHDSSCWSPTPRYS